MKRLLIIILVVVPVFCHALPTTLRQQMAIMQKEWNVHFVYDASLNIDVAYNGASIRKMQVDDALKSLFDNQNILYSRHGCNIILRKKAENKKNNSKVMHIRKHVMKCDTILPEVTVTGNLNSPLLTTQTGKRVLTSGDINTEYSFMSTPDLVKTLQHISGVNNGVELLSGLYVHGGGADENLFLIDDAPVYQTNHSLGLFSAFNTDVIKDVEFYKSGFPARYSGRVSSITDVSTADGNMKESHGLLAIGTLDGRFHLEGPIFKYKTSYNVSMRRSWLDIIAKPLLKFATTDDDGEHYTFDYAFYDLNAKIVHRINMNSTLRFNAYSSNDRYGIIDESVWHNYTTENKNKFSWGNTNVSLAWETQPSSNMTIRVHGIGSYSHSMHNMSEEDRLLKDNGIRVRNSLYIRNSNTEMYDASMKVDILYLPMTHHHIRFGGQVLHHWFQPQTIQQSFYYGDIDVDTTSVESKCNIESTETNIYAEDEMMLLENLSANVGTSLSVVNVDGKTYHMFDPRLAVKYQITNELSLKMSYTHMSQSIHRISSTFLDMPTDYWVPTTKDIHPTMSHQLAAGVYAKLSRQFTLTLESFYKRTDHLLQYRNWMGLQPSALRWDKDITEGQGTSYGVEFDGVYKTDKLRAEANYTLGWSMRKFKEIYNGWYYDQFDNRHRVNIMLRYFPTNKMSFYAAWTIHSGNRMTLPTQYTVMPQMPGETENSNECGFVYEKPNNVTMPTYHRLDLGANFLHIMSKGREGVWNFSIYNAYCHLNAMYTSIRTNEDGTFSTRNKGYIPIIPSVSYTLKF